MKKLAILFFVLISLSFNVISDKQANTTISENVDGCNYGQCNATAKSTGNRCKHCVSNYGDSYCWQHE